MNKVVLIGRLTKDPYIRKGETAVAKYTLAVDRKSKDKTADYISCVTFGHGAEFAEKYLKKGIKIAVVGRIQTGAYDTKDGKTVYTTDVVVEDHEFCEPKKESNQTEAENGWIPEIPESLPFV